MLLLKIFLILLAIGGAWRLIACAYAGRAAWWFAILYSLFFVAVIGYIGYYLSKLHTLTHFILLFILLLLLYLPILGCFTKGWKERQETSGNGSGSDIDIHSGHDSSSDSGGDGGGGD